MSTNTVVCFACRGQKECAGMGGILKKCEKCSGKGRIERAEPVLHAVKPVEPVAAVAPTVAVKAAPKRKSRAKAKAADAEPGTKDMFQDTVSLAQIVSGEAAKMPAPVIDELTQAVLEEIRMKPEEWEAKYKHISRLFGINQMTQKFECLVTQVQRAAIRANFAAMQPRVTRKVNVKKSQDMAAEDDAEYLSFKAQEEAREARAAEAQ